MKATLILAAILLSGCATTTTSAYDDACTARATRTVGMGVTTERCVAWTFGPTRYQAKHFGNPDKFLRAGQRVRR
jgi:outer membrane lipoprotein SlyB